MDRFKDIPPREDCHCQKEDNHPVLELREYTSPKSGSVYIFHPEIIFVVRGGMDVTVDGDGSSLSMKEWDFIFVPIGTTLSCRIAENSAVLIVRITSEYPECPAVGMRLSSPPVEEMKPDGIYSLQANERIRYFIKGFLAVFGDGLKCRNYMKMEVDRILYLIHAYYTIQERVRFFSSVISVDIEFSEFVRKKWIKYLNVKELSHVMNMSERQFAHRFKKVFGMTARQWIQRQKSQLVYHDICTSDCPIKEIAKKYNFTPGSFVRYCHKHFGSSPGVIRKKLTVDLDWDIPDDSFPES